MSFCSRCDEWNSRYHVCPPMWLVWNTEWDGEEDGQEIHGQDADAAAEKWAELSDGGGDYSIVGGSDVLLGLRNVVTGEVVYRDVSGESVPSYNASDVDLARMKRKVAHLLAMGRVRCAGKLYGQIWMVAT